MTHEELAKKIASLIYRHIPDSDASIVDVSGNATDVYVRLDSGESFTVTVLEDDS